jgi:uncharacterized RDD family membrane protein YckC
MADTTNSGSAVVSSKPRYARFSRRLRAIFIDWILLWASIVATMLIAIGTGSNDVTRVLGIVLLTAAALYEPVLVAATGSTLGHYLTNLRVADADSASNLGFLRAVVRLVFKLLLGPLSFVTMLATRRNQALHDALTHSIVQLRDPAIADPSHYIDERDDLADARLPSKPIRLLVIVLYLLLIFLLAMVVFAIVVQAGLLSPACVASDRCSFGEQLLNASISAIWLALTAAAIGFGWRGRLYGARRTTASHDNSR